MTLIYSILQIAHYWINQDDQMTYKKLQNILYYSYSWSIVLWNDSYHKHNLSKLFQADWVATTNGPRNDLIKHQFSQFGFRQINKSYALVQLDNKSLDLLNQINDIYAKNYSGLKLDRLVQQEMPYKRARKIKYSKLSDKDIFSYYGNLVN